MTLDEGANLHGYQLEELVGTGAMGEVWRARQGDAVVAIKVGIPRPDIATERMLAEARIVAELEHPHVVRYVGQGAWEGRPYLVLEYLEGETLASRVLAAGPMTRQEVAEVMRQGCLGLEALHTVGVIHRDVKPSNLFLARNGQEETLKVLDFGVSKTDAFSGTMTGQVLGTPHYMSPEQLVDSKRVDPRCDLWGLAAVSYFCLTAQPPFGAANVAQLSMRYGQRPASIPRDLGADLAAYEGWLQRAFHPDPAARFQSARELGLSVRRALLGG